MNNSQKWIWLNNQHFHCIFCSLLHTYNACAPFHHNFCALLLYITDYGYYYSIQLFEYSITKSCKLKHNNKESTIRHKQSKLVVSIWLYILSPKPNSNVASNNSPDVSTADHLFLHSETIYSYFQVWGRLKRNLN